jgi:hypothetical protein
MKIGSFIIEDACVDRRRRETAVDALIILKTASCRRHLPKVEVRKRSETDAESLTRMRRDVVPRFILHLVGHVRVVRIPKLLVICAGRERWRTRRVDGVDAT